MDDFEKPALFYLGKKVDPKTGILEQERELFNAKELTTHAVCVGMTGSGKTGLGIAILEEAAIDNIPAIIIDPKGDLANLLLTFPTLTAEEFTPWVEKGDAAEVAKTWREGLASWDETPERIAKLKSAVDMQIYTPASSMGVPLSILDSLNAPPEDDRRDKILSVASSLLGLLGINTDPIKSREHILLSTIMDQAWKKGENLDIADLIHQVQKPNFSSIGALDIDTFYPPKERMELSIKLNNLLASPVFQAWMEGEPLDINRLLYTQEGKPKLAIISIAHLSDSERMFFVTLLLNECISWMRQQSGTANLRALLYMDEIFGYFPPTAMPPSKLPMLTLLKQARAFGLGIVLVTQNPVDLDYKGLANCGSWFIGKLQTERDKMRVLEGLKVASNGEIDTKTLDKMIAMTGKRTFILRSIYRKDPTLFQTRWTLSYLRGPLTLQQIASLTKKRGIEASGLFEYLATDKPLHYVQRLYGVARLCYVDSKNKISVSDKIALLDDQVVADLKLVRSPVPNSTFGKNLYQTGDLEEQFVKAVTQNKSLLQDFKKRLVDKQYEEKIELISQKLTKAEQRLEDKKGKSWRAIFQTAVSFITTIFSIFLGRKALSKETVSKTGTTLRRAGRLGEESDEVTRAQENYDALRQELEELQQAQDRVIEKIDIAVEKVAIVWIASL